jgi:hypothetical protein
MYAVSLFVFQQSCHDGGFAAREIIFVIFFCKRRYDKFVCNPRRAVQTHYSLRLSVLGMMTVINCSGGFCGFPKEKLLFSDAEFILNMSSNFTINYLHRH